MPSPYDKNSADIGALKEVLISTRLFSLGMEVAKIKERLVNRYFALISLLTMMTFTHILVIPIHPLIFLVWPLSLLFLIEIFIRVNNNKLRLAFIVTFIVHASITGQLVVYRLEGIFFDFQPVHNLSTISYVVLAEVLLIFLYDALVSSSLTFRDIPVYIGFASVIPWLSPALVEFLILARWSLKGTFSLMTAGKSIGGAHIYDILFYYGSRNLVVLSALFGASILVLHSSRRLIQFQKVIKLKRTMKAKDIAWLTKAWEHPLALLNNEERELFLDDHGHLELEQQNDVLRNELLPAKGIFLLDPKSLS